MNRSRDRAQNRPTAEQTELLFRAAGITGETLSDFVSTIAPISCSGLYPSCFQRLWRLRPRAVWSTA